MQTAIGLWGTCSCQISLKSMQNQKPPKQWLSKKMATSHPFSGWPRQGAASHEPRGAPSPFCGNWTKRSYYWCWWLRQNFPCMEKSLIFRSFSQWSHPFMMENSIVTRSAPQVMVRWWSWILWHYGYVGHDPQNLHQLSHGLGASPYIKPTQTNNVVYIYIKTKK